LLSGFAGQLGSFALQNSTQLVRGVCAQRKLPSQKVANFLAELYKTADYRDRQDIEKYAIHRTKVRANP
jgi:hypothetical protein